MENLNTKLYTMKNTINKMKTELNSVHNKNTNYSFQDNKIQKKKNFNSNNNNNNNYNNYNNIIALQKKVKDNNEFNSLFDSGKKEENGKKKIKKSMSSHFKYPIKTTKTGNEISFYNKNLMAFTNIQDEDYSTNRDKNTTSNYSFLNFKKNITSKNINSYRSNYSVDVNKKKESKLYYDYNKEIKNGNYSSYYDINPNNNHKIVEKIKNLLLNSNINEIYYKANAFDENSNNLLKNYKRQYGTYNNNIEDFYFYLQQKIGRDYYYKKELNLYRQLCEKLINISDKKDIEEIKTLVNIQSKDKKNENYMRKIKKILNNM